MTSDDGRRPIAPLLKTALFTVLVPGMVAGLVPMWLRGGRGAPWPTTPLWRVAIGAVVLGIGVAIYLWCAWDFATAGRGTPSPTHPPRSLVVRGLYRYSRNPMYVGVVLAVVGQGVWFTSGATLIYAVALAVGFHLRVVFVEERTLRRLFGDAYLDYTRRVPRWIGHGESSVRPAAAPLVTLTDAGFTVRDASGTTIDVAWPQVRRAAAYKRDLYTTDAIMLLFELDPPAPSLVELSEEWPGFADLFGPMEQALGVSPAWYVEIMTPAFETTPRILYERPAPASATPARPAPELTS